ncbi:hypothetical protein MAP00_000068 [Monascus purpureus]|nr:hypothetical protein MAP00_000068 [Monascus purpureus]
MNTSSQSSLNWLDQQNSLFWDNLQCLCTHQILHPFHSNRINSTANQGIWHEHIEPMPATRPHMQFRRDTAPPQRRGIINNFIRDYICIANIDNRRRQPGQIDPSRARRKRRDGGISVSSWDMMNYFPRMESFSLNASR